ncbi:uncharacterized protein LOC111733910 [Pteropus vampyrus]|uniref:Uncharacterized protein LOC111733910 n=1 Tax=Pteropus vampyrus TaxID=132908 RepID=A0A6P6C399_PTEVA|nr:uncharacterized protein LOC111733910 [Pteropus vampyrus]
MLSSHNLDCTLLQYVDDLLLAAETEEICLAAIRDLLGTLEAFGYRVLAKKAQLCTQSVAYLRYTLEGGKRTLSRQRIEAILQIPVPTTKRQTYRNIHQPRVWELIVTETSEIVAQNITSHSTPEIRVDLCRLARDPLTIATAGHQLGSGSFVGRAFVGGGAYLGYKGGPGCGILLAEKSLLGIGLYICPQGISGSMRNRGLNCEGKGQFSCANWGCETISTIDNYKKQNDNHIELIRGPTPSTCSLESYNPLIITIKTGSLGGQHYWEPKLRTKKLRLSNKLGRRTDYGARTDSSGTNSVMSLEYKGQYWLTNAQMVRYQGMLCENPRIRLEVVRTLNLATLLPIGPSQPDHHCIEVMNEVFSSPHDLTDQPLKDLGAEYYTDGSSFVRGGEHLAGCAVVALHSITEAKPLTRGTSAQKVEFITLL